MVKNVAIVGEGVKNLAYTSLAREIESWTEKVFKLDERIIDLEDEFETEVNMKKRKIYKERRDNLSKNIEKAKKRYQGL